VKFASVKSARTEELIGVKLFENSLNTKDVANITSRMSSSPSLGILPAIDLLLCLLHHVFKRCFGRRLSVRRRRLNCRLKRLSQLLVDVSHFRFPFLLLPALE